MVPTQQVCPLFFIKSRVKSCQDGAMQWKDVSVVACQRQLALEKSKGKAEGNLFRRSMKI